MQRIICTLIVLVTPLLLAADAADDVRKELKALEGKWTMVGGEAAGTPFPKDGVPAFTFIIGAEGKSKTQTPRGETQSTITVNPAKSPKTIDNLHEDGAQKGKKQLGIYKLEGDKFTVCMTLPGVAESDRPKDFSSKESLGVLFVFERVKEEKKP